MSEPEIHRAARIGDTDALARLVASGVDIDTRADAEVGEGSQLEGLTPLMTAARSVDGAGAETIAWLLANGADPHAVSRGGVTAAWYAAGKGGRWWHEPWVCPPEHAERLRRLLDAGLDPRESSCTGRSLLAEACHAGDADAVALLLERGADIEPSAGWTDEANDFRTSSKREAPRPDGVLYADQIPLFGAVASGSLACVEMLLARGVRRDRIDTYDNDALDVALSQESYLRVIDVERQIQRPPRGPNPAHCEIAQRLMEAGVPLERADDYGRSRLYRAAFDSQEGAVAFLLERGASMAPNARGETPLHAICWHGSSTRLQTEVWQRIIRRLVAAGAPLEGEPSPLQSAIYGDVPCPESIATLLELGADPNARDARGRSPLHYAADATALPCVRVLLAHGADPRCVDARERTPRDIALRLLDRDPPSRNTAPALIDLLESAATAPRPAEMRRSEARIIPSPVEREAIQSLYDEMAPEFWQRLHTLEAKQYRGSLTGPEQAELQALVDREEAWNDRRLAFLAELAQSYGMPPDYFLDSLGIRYHPLSRKAWQ